MDKTAPIADFMTPIPHTVMADLVPGAFIRALVHDAVQVGKVQFAA